MDPEPHVSSATFLGVPIEVRQQIYEIVFRHVYYDITIDRQLAKCRGTSLTDSTKRTGVRYLPSILLSCRQCYAEGYSLLLRRLAVGRGFCSSDTVKELPERIPDHFRLNLNRLEPIAWKTELSLPTLKTVFPNLKEIDLAMICDNPLFTRGKSSILDKSDHDLLALISGWYSMFEGVSDADKHNQVSEVNVFGTLTCCVISQRHTELEERYCTRCHGSYEEVWSTTSTSVHSADLYTVVHLLAQQAEAFAIYES